MNRTKLDSFVVFPRHILSDLRGGVITYAEFSVLCYLRLSCDPYGVSNTSLENINNDVFQGRNTKNYINKIMLSLKSKKFLYYKSRRGHRGSFEIHFGEIPLPNGQIRTLDKFFNINSVRSSARSETSFNSEEMAEPSMSRKELSQKLKEVRSSLSFTNYGKSQNSVRSNNNDN